MTNHTPTPWRHVLLDVDTSEVVGSDNSTVCSNEEYYPHSVSEEDMKFIVRACNAHDDLLAALERARDNLLLWTDTKHGAIVQIDAVLFKAGVK